MTAEQLVNAWIDSWASRGWAIQRDWHPAVKADLIERVQAELDKAQEASEASGAHNAATAGSTPAPATRAKR